MAELSGRVALVTGAGQGIGTAIAAALAEAGAQVIATDVRDQPDLGGGVRVRAHDVRDAERWEEIVDEVERDFHRLDILVNNAGVAGYEHLHELSLAEWNRIVSVNQTGVLHGVQQGLRMMLPQRSGSIVNIASICGASSVPGIAAYHASKHSVCTMTKNVAVSHAREGIRANAVLPGWIRTPLTLAQTDEVNRTYLDGTPMSGGGQPRDIADAVCFLASDRARFITGVDLPVDGGYLAR